MSGASAPDNDTVVADLAISLSNLRNSISSHATLSRTFDELEADFVTAAKIQYHAAREMIRDARRSAGLDATPKE